MNRWSSIPWSMLVRISVRNLFRHRRRNSLLLFSVITAVASVTFLNALMRGIQVDMYASARENLNGDWLVTARTYPDDPAFMHHFKPSATTDAHINEITGVRSTQRVRSPAVIMSERETRGVEIVGIDPVSETFSFIRHAAVDGKFPQHVDDRGIVLGQALAEDLRTRIGKRVVLVFRGADGHSREMGIPVIGLFDADGTALEKRFAFVARNSLIGLPRDVVTEISISAQGSGSGLTTEAVKQMFPNLAVRTWRQLEPQAAALFDMLDHINYLFFAIIMAALGFGLVNAWVTAILERQREFGVMRCLGMNRASVLLQVSLESGVLMLVGIIVGTLFGFTMVAATGGSIDLGRWSRGLDIVGFRSHMSVVIEVRDLLSVGVLSLFFAALACIIPAMRANRVPVLQAVAGP